MSARSQMTMRAVVEELANPGITDTHGNPEPPQWKPKAVVPCRAWSHEETSVIDGEKLAIIEGIRCHMPLDASISESDRVTAITDRLSTLVGGPGGRTYFSGPFEIQTAQAMAGYKFLNLRAIS